MTEKSCDFFLLRQIKKVGLCNVIIKFPFYALDRFSDTRHSTFEYGLLLNLCGQQVSMTWTLSKNMEIINVINNFPYYIDKCCKHFKMYV